MVIATDGITIPLDLPFFTGTSSSQEVPGLYDVAINGRAYMVDRNHDITGFRSMYNRSESIPVLRTQADTSDHPGEASINPEGLWRRAQESWHHGSGQMFMDRDKSTSDLNRFNTSKGIDWWTQWQASLLPDTTNQYPSANTNLKCVAVNGYLYVIDGQTLKYSNTALPGTLVWTTVTGTPAATATDITTDGTTVYVAYGASGIYTTTVGAASASSFVTGTVDYVAYVKGRLMAAHNNILYNIVGSGALPTPLMTHSNSGFVWSLFAGGPNNIYLGGSAADHTLIYRSTIVTDGTSMTAPVVAGELPAGEQLTALRGYFGFLAIGTNQGLRIGSLSSAGDVTLGPLIPTASSVQALGVWDRFVFYGLTNYDSTSTGLGRADLSVFTTTLAPAYASDLMATGQGAVTWVGTYRGKRVFAVAGVGVFAESANLVPSGTLVSGSITYGIADAKVGIFVDLRHTALPSGASVAVAVAADGGAPSTVGTSSQAGTTQLANQIVVGGIRAERFELTYTLSRGTDPTTGPTLTRGVLRSQPAPDRLEVHTVPIILHERVQVDDVDRTYDIAAELTALRSLRDNSQVVNFQDGASAYQVIIIDTNFVKSHRTENRQQWNGTLVVTMKQVG